MKDQKIGSYFLPDIDPDHITTFEERGENGETETCKAVSFHPILNGILNKAAFFKTHAAAVWYNKLKNITVLQKLDSLTSSIHELNANMKRATRITVTSLCPENYEVRDSSVYTKNGICFVWIYVYCIDPVPTTQNRKIFATLPKPERMFTYVVDYNGYSKDIARLGCYVSNTGTLELISGQAGKYYSLVFSYPVKE